MCQRNSSLKQIIIKIVNHYIDIVIHYRQHVRTQQNLRTDVEVWLFQKSAKIYPRTCGFFLP